MGELIVILVLALSFSDPSGCRIVATTLGKAIRCFRKATRDLTDQLEIDERSSSRCASCKAALRDEPRRRNRWRRCSSRRRSRTWHRRRRRRAGSAGRARHAAPPPCRRRSADPSAKPIDKRADGRARRPTTHRRRQPERRRAAHAVPRAPRRAAHLPAQLGDRALRRHHHRLRLPRVPVRAARAPADRRLGRRADRGRHRQAASWSSPSPIEGFMVLFKLALLVRRLPRVAVHVPRDVAVHLARAVRRASASGASASSSRRCCCSSAAPRSRYLYVLPARYKYFLGYSAESLGIIKEVMGTTVDVTLSQPFDIKPMITMDEYFGLTSMLLLVFGAVFELPLRPGGAGDPRHRLGGHAVALQPLRDHAVRRRRRGADAGRSGRRAAGDDRRR